MRFLIPSLVLGLAAPVPAQAPPATKLTVTPSAEPVPALKYHLLPTFMDRSPGNGAQEYYRAITARPANPSAADRAKTEEAAEAWLKGPVAPPPAAVRRLLDESGGAFRLADRGARSDRCDWDLDARVRADVMGTLIPEVQPMMEISRHLAWRARAEIADGKYESAARDLQTGLQMARDTNRVPMLIHAMVAGNMAKDHLQQVEAWIARPGSPNLYWALAGLPRPFLDLRKPIELEAGFPDTIPWLGLKKMEAGPVSKEEADRVVGAWIKNGIQAATPEELKKLGLDRPLSEVGLAAVLTLRYPAAKKWLVEHGRAAAEVDAMPAAQAVYLYDLGLLREMRDDLFKWYSLPYPEAHDGLRRTARRQREALDEHWNDPLLKVLATTLPALEKLHLAAARTDRQIAALRAVEAVRLHAAAHGGKPPAVLDEVTAVPVPADPITGKPFGYAAKGDTFTLSAPPPEGEQPNPGNSLAYEITVRAK